MKNKINRLLLSLVGLLVISLSSCLKDNPNESIGVINDGISIYQVRNLWKGKDLNLDKKTLGGSIYTSGVVISQVENGNFPEGYLAIESNWRGQVRGILIQVNDPSQFDYGDSLLVKVEGGLLSNATGSLVISNLSENAVRSIAFNKVVAHKSVSIGTLKRNPDVYESTLISVTSDVDGWSQGTTLEGRHLLTDANGNELYINTFSSAVFKDVKLAPNATFEGVMLNSTSGEMDLYLQEEADMNNPSGKLYAGWPESFENPAEPKGSYNMPDIDNIANFDTGPWYLYYSIVGNTAGRDRIVSGENAIRVQQNRTEDSYVQMDFDVPNGASKVTFWYGAYYTDRSSTFTLEYSLDGGFTWQQMGDPISDAQTTAESKDARMATFLMDIQQPVRFRINKWGLGTSSPTISNGRLGIDDFSIYESF